MHVYFVVIELWAFISLSESVSSHLVFILPQMIV